MEMYVGLDVHSKQSVFVIEDENGKVVARGEVPTSREGMERLRTEHALPAGTAVGLETGTVSFFVARELSRVGLRPIDRPRRVIGATRWNCARGFAEGSTARSYTCRRSK